MRLEETYTGAEAQRFALEPPPYGAGWPEVADEAETILVYESEPSDPGHQFVLLLAYDAEGNEVGRKQLGGEDTDTAEGLDDDSGSERRWICLP
jgi:hypothetical protein